MIKKSLITASVLSIFALICAALLGVVNFFTSPVIKAHEEENIKKSISLVCPLYDSNTMDITTNEDSKAKTTYLVSSKETEELLYVIYIVDATGYASTIEMMISVDKDYKITGYKVLSSAETKGDIKSHDFNMIGSNNLDSFDTLAGSTYSSKAVKKCFKLALSYAKEEFEGGQK